MDLLKAFYAMDHDLLIATLGKNNFQEDIPFFMKHYLPKKQQRVRVNGTNCLE